jgi:hypothetical protein
MYLKIVFNIFVVILPNSCIFKILSEIEQSDFTRILGYAFNKLSNTLAAGTVLESGEKCQVIQCKFYT